jgi:hypothetical protein
MVNLPIHIVVKSLWQHALLDPTLFVNTNTNILTNNAPKLTAFKFEFKPGTNRIRKEFARTKV